MVGDGTVQLWCNSHRREDVVPAMKNSLATLRLDYVDMYLMHWPIALKVGYTLYICYTLNNDCNCGF